MFRIVIVGWKVEQYIERCLNSVLTQSVSEWTACIVLDPAEDRTVEIAESFSLKDPRFKVVSNNKRMYAIPNIIHSIIEQHPSDNDIIATLDADDWLSGPNTLEIVKRYYDRNPELLVTHGSWISYPNPNIPTNNHPYTAEDWIKGVRQVPWRATHLRTFKYRVWKHVKDEDLRGADGKYYDIAWDLAIMLPMLEIAGKDRVQYVAEHIYTYNQETPYNDYKLRLKDQESTADSINKKEPYAYIENP